MDHIDSFEDICSTTQLNGVSKDFMHCKLFNHSLADRALRWLKSLPANSIETWDECKAKFLNHFYTSTRTNNLRNKISQFQQGPVESFYEAWDRFKEYLRDCPHHGFSELNLLNTFYRGVDQKYQLSLDTASNGDFMTKPVNEAYKLIDNLAASNSNHCPDYDRRGISSSSDSSGLAEVKDLLTQFLKKQNEKQVSFAEDVEKAEADCFAVQEPENLEEVSYINSQGQRVYNQGYNPGYNKGNLSWRSTNVANPQDQAYPQQNTFVQKSGQQFAQKSGGFQQPSQPGFQQTNQPQGQQDDKT